MATAPIVPEPISASFTTLNVRVGAAQWTVTLSAEAVGRLRDISTPEPCLDLERAMESLRRKAVSLRLYGGGSIWLDAADVVPPIAPLVDENGLPLKRPRWYSVIGCSANDRD